MSSVFEEVHRSWGGGGASITKTAAHSLVPAFSDKGITLIEY